MGAGGVGGYYGARLASHGHDVTFVARGVHLEAMRARGLVLREHGETRVLQPVRVAAAPGEADGNPAFVLFTVKGYDTETAARALRPALGPGTAVLTLQNGVDSVERLEAILDPLAVLAGTTTIESTVAEPGVIERAGPTPRIVLGEPGGGMSARAETIAAAFREAGVDAAVSPDVGRVLWEKFVRLAPGASLTTACQATIGEVRSTPEGAALYRALIAEAVAVGRAAGVALPPDAVEQALRFIHGLPAAMKTSMQRDFERRRPVELDQLTGALVRRGRELGVPTPTFDTVYAILRVRALAFGGVPGEGAAPCP